MAIEAGLVLFFVFVVLLVLGMPIAISIAFSSMMTLLLVIPFDVSAFSSAQKMVGSINSFSLIAIPFFVLSGIIMNNGGIAKKLVDFAMLFVGRVPGALAHTNVLGNALFGSISSSAIAASTAIGGVLIPQQVEEGYDRKFATAVNIASAPTGMVIPPSTAFIMYSLVAGGASISALFMGGYLVGALWALGIMLVAFIVAKKNKYPVVEKGQMAHAGKIIKEAIPSLLLIVINIGGPGFIEIDGQKEEMKKQDGYYIGKETRHVVFSSQDAENPAKFYISSVPAHHKYPNVKISIDQVKPMETGEGLTLNERKIYQYIHPNVCESCQLQMGYTILEPGSAWNTMPCHTHERRMEAYVYFDYANEDTCVFHMMGKPDETKHLVVDNEQAIISPSWSIHSGVGTSNYSFIWAMCGENITYTDMDMVQMDQLK